MSTHGSFGALCAYLPYQTKSEQSGGSPHCRFGFFSISGEPISEDILHIVSCCLKTSQIRNRILSDIEAICGKAQTIISFYNLCQNPEEIRNLYWTRQVLIYTKE